EHGESASQPTAPILFLACLCLGGGPTESCSRGNRMGGASSRNHPSTSVEGRRPGAHHRAKDLDPLYQSVPLAEPLCLGLGSAALLNEKELPDQNLSRSPNPQVKFVQTRTQPWPEPFVTPKRRAQIASHKKNDSQNARIDTLIYPS